MKFELYRCKHCGKIIAIVKGTGVPTFCCGDEMELLRPQKEGSVPPVTEKHVPVVKTCGNRVTVTVGTEKHPMLEEHQIEWILIKTNLGIQQKCLRPGDEPKAMFLLLKGEKIEDVFDYCNVHSLWEK